LQEEYQHLLYLLSLPLQLLTTGSLLQQGSKALIILTSIHARLVVALFWGLLANALVATQVVEDGTLSSLIVCPYPCFLFCLVNGKQNNLFISSHSLSS